MALNHTETVVCYNPGSTSADCWAARIEQFLTEGIILGKQTFVLPANADEAARQALLLNYIQENAQFSASDVRCLGVRGAILPGALPGVTRVDQGVLNACAAGYFGTIHPCNNAPTDGWAVARELGLTEQIYFADPVSSEDPLYIQACKMSGRAELPIDSHAHYLALREMIVSYATEASIPTNRVRGIFIYAGGGGFSIAAVKDGSIVAVSNPNQVGSPGITRCCDVPSLDFARWVLQLAQQGHDFKSVAAKLLRESGLMSYLGDLKVTGFEDIVGLARTGNIRVQNVLDMWYFRIAEEIGKRLTALNFKADVLYWAGAMTQATELPEGVYQHVQSMIPSNRVVAEDLEIRSLTRQTILAFQGKVPINTYTYPA
ncbi:MAG: hypothetical protein PHY34_04485 [Patescibacteria group bacterium]|nr:hypothetical protein [Patescibacteria group bacterium]MDD5715686.1 hypothetical protein [Patescibacteria group bacterium]